MGKAKPVVLDLNLGLHSWPKKKPWSSLSSD